MRIRKAKIRDAPRKIKYLLQAQTLSYITSSACDDDGLSQRLMVTSWARDFCLEKMLLDGGSLVELINRKLVASMRPRPKYFQAVELKSA